MPVSLGVIYHLVHYVRSAVLLPWDNFPWDEDYPAPEKGADINHGCLHKMLSLSSLVCLPDTCPLSLQHLIDYNLCNGTVGNLYCLPSKQLNNMRLKPMKHASSILLNKARDSRKVSAADT